MRLSFVSNVPLLTNHRTVTSIYSQYFSAESDVKRRRLEVEERKLLLQEKAQILDLFKAGIYTPETAHEKIEKIDRCAKPPSSCCHDTSNPNAPSQSLLGSRGQRCARSPSLDHQSSSCNVEDLDDF